MRVIVFVDFFVLVCVLFLSDLLLAGYCRVKHSSDKRRLQPFV